MTRIDLPAPLDLSASFQMFRRSGDDLIDRWDGVQLVRTLPVNGRAVAFAARIEGGIENPALCVTVEDRRWEEAVVEALRRSLFVLPPQEYADLLRSDAALAALEARWPGVRQVRQLDLFTALVRCVSTQQVNLRWAVTTRRRLAETFGERHSVAGQVVYRLDPERLAEAPVEGIRALQFTTSKSRAIVAVAQALASGEVRLDELSSLSDADVIDRLVHLKGIGRWSAEWVLARTLGRPCVVAGDLGVQKAVGLVYLGTSRPTEQEVRQATAHWGPSAGVAQAVLLHALGEGGLSAR